MNIEKPGPVESSGAYRVGQTATKGLSRSSSARAVSGPGTDEVVLSAEARLRQELLARLKELPEVREEFLAELAERLSKGEYAAEPERVAEVLWEEMRQERS